MTTATQGATAPRGNAGGAPLTCSQGLRLDAGGEDLPCVWNVVAYEGKWNGHVAGQFAFTRATFEQIVANFRKDPRYTRRAGQPPVTEASPEQIASGDYDVLQWDFHHASEMAPTEGNIAAQGAPSQGWVLELKIAEHEGKCALAALTRWLEPARTYIKTDRYKFCSVSVWLDATDPASGENVGAVLTSIAITNNPFLQGLPPLRASRDASPQTVADLTEWVAQVQGILATLNVSAAVAAPSQENTMDVNATGAKSATDAQKPAAGGPDLRITLARIVAKQRNCSVDDVGDHHVLAAVENAATLQANIDELMAALGAKTLAEALAKMSAADDLKSKLSEALAGKAAAEDAMQGYEDGMVEEDVGMALASLGVTDSDKAGKIKNALLAERGKTPETIAAFRKTYDVVALRKAARERLQKAASEIVAERSGADVAHLSASIATQRQTPPATAQAISATMGADGRITLAAPQSQEPRPGVAHGLTLTALRQQYPGEPNDFARKVAFVKAEHTRNNPGAKPLDNDAACERAHALTVA